MVLNISIKCTPQEIDNLTPSDTAQASPVTSLLLMSYRESTKATTYRWQGSNANSFLIVNYSHAGCDTIWFFWIMYDLDSSYGVYRYIIFVGHGVCAKGSTPFGGSILYEFIY